jgi:two-component system, NarL family, sensor kinase
VAVTLVCSWIAVAWGPNLRRDQAAVAVWLLVTAAVAAMLIARVPRNAVGWLLGGVAVCVSVQSGAVAIAAVAAQGGLAVVAAWVSHWIAIPGFGCLALIVVLFPTGRTPSRGWRWLSWLIVSGVAVLTVTTALLPAPVGGLDIDNPLARAAAAGGLAVAQRTAEIAVVVGGLAAVVALAGRFRRSVGDERQQLKWVLFATGLLLATLVFAVSAPGPLNELSFVLALAGLTSVPVAIGVAVLEYHLFDIDRLINRTLVYGLLSVLVVALYVAAVGSVVVVFDRALGVASSLAATAIVAVAFQPLRTRLQRVVDRLVYGQRNDPGAAIATLTQQLRQVTDPSTVPRQVVETVAVALKLPFVAIELSEGGKAERAASASATHGEPTGRIETLPIVWQAEQLATLLVGGEQILRARDRQLLERLAHQLAPAFAALRLDRALERSTQRLVVAREEERRLLRSDLHDGLGPQLAGLAMGLDAVGNLLERDPAAAREAVARLRTRSQEAIETVRAVSRGLRPPALDALGLARAIHQHAASLTTERHQVEVATDTDLSGLPAAVEVATYHICLEAIANAARHANASRTTVRLRLASGALEVSIEDDGQGLSARSGAGVGLASMRRRAEELGGSLVITPHVPQGTSVRAVVPTEPS